jgi:hypothetical protein
MNTATLALLLKIAALLHLPLIWAGLSMPAAVNLRTHLASLPQFIRRLFLVYFTFIGLMLVGFASLTFLYAAVLASGESLAVGFCILLTIFWTIRLVAAGFIFDVKPYLTSWFYRLGYHSINVVFIYLTIVYALAAWHGFTH